MPPTAAFSPPPRTQSLAIHAMPFHGQAPAGVTFLGAGGVLLQVLPMFHFYRGAEGKVDGFSCTVSKIQKFKVSMADLGVPHFKA